MGVGGSCECEREHEDAPTLENEEAQMVPDQAEPDTVEDRRKDEEAAAAKGESAPGEAMSPARVEEVLQSASQGSMELAQVIKSNPRVLDRNPALAARVEMLNARLSRVKTAVEQKREGGWFQASPGQGTPSP